MSHPKRIPLQGSPDLRASPVNVCPRIIHSGRAGTFPQVVDSPLPAILAATRTSARHNSRNRRADQRRQDSSVRPIAGRNPAIPRRKITSMSNSSATGATSRLRHPGSKRADLALRMKNTSSSNATSNTANPPSAQHASPAETHLSKPGAPLASPCTFTTTRKIPTSAFRRAVSPGQFLLTSL